MDEVNSCFLCKSLNTEANSVEVTGSLLENIIRIKVLGDLPVDFPHGGGKLCMCHDCQTVVEGIQYNLNKLKDRIVKRKFRVRYANVHFTKSQNEKMTNKDAVGGDVDECDMSDTEDGKLKSEEDRRDSLTSVISSVSLPHSHVGSNRDLNQSHMNDDREVHIKVPSAVNATFIIVQTQDEIAEHGTLDNTQNVRALLESKQISDVISVPVYGNAQHVDLKRIASPSVTTSRVTSESPIDEPLKEQTPPQPTNNQRPSVPTKHHRSSLGNVLEQVSLHQQERLEPRSRHLSTASNPGVVPNRGLPSHPHDLPTKIPKIVTPDQRHDSHVLDLSSQLETGSPLQLVPEDNLQEYLNQRRRSYDVHYPKERHAELQHVGIINHEAKLRYGNMSGGALHLDPDRGRFLAMPNVPMEEPCQKVFHCEVCGKGFERKGLWKRHMLNAHQEQAFTCSQCGVKVVDRMSLHIHESREHGHIAGTVPLLSVSAPASYDNPENRDNNKARKKMQYCEDCREHFTSKYDLLRHRVTTGHMGGAGGVCSDRGDRLDPSQPRILGNRLHPNPYEALQRKPPPLLREGRSFRRMESLDDSNVPYVKTELEKDYFSDRRRSAGALVLDSHRLRRVAEDAGVYSADGQQIGMKVSSSSDKYDDSP